jgi:hypothetical protein
VAKTIKAAQAKGLAVTSNANKLNTSQRSINVYVITDFIRQVYLKLTDFHTVLLLGFCISKPSYCVILTFAFTHISEAMVIHITKEKN